MRLIGIQFSLLILVLLAGCHPSVTPEESETADYTYTEDLSRLKHGLNGKWTLIDVTAMIPNPAIPNVQLVVANNRITVIQDEKQIDQVSFEIIKTQNYLYLKTTAQPGKDNWYVRNPGLRVSSNRLFLDTGMATDLPGYMFKRIE
ncbi:hypothetical protein [Spirosoma aerophilum]